MFQQSCILRFVTICIVLVSIFENPWRQQQMKSNVVCVLVRNKFIQFLPTKMSYVPLAHS
jgi:hypothetical protein